MRTRYRENKIEAKVNGNNEPLKKKSPEFKLGEKKLLKHHN